MATWPRAKGGVEDLIFHDPTVGSAVQTMLRKGFGTNPNVNVTKISANDIPLLNALLTSVTGSASPWGHLTSQNAELALADLARKKQEAVNVVTEGCVLNDNTTATARRNREVLDVLMGRALAQTYVQPWYFPPGQLYVERPVADGGTVTFPLYDYTAGTPVTPLGLCLLGETGNSLIKQTTSVGASEDLCLSRGAQFFTATGLEFWNRSGNTGRNLTFLDDTVAVSPQDIFRILDCRFVAGGEGIVFAFTSGFRARNIWIERNTFTSQSVRGLQLRNVTDALVRTNYFVGGYSDAAILCNAGATGEFLLRVLVSQNNCLGSSSGIRMLRSAGTFVPGAMAYNGIVGNYVADGNISHTDLDQQVIDGNILQNGRVQFSMTVSSQVFTGMKCRANEQKSSGTDGLEFSVTGGAICRNPQVIGGEYSENNEHGIEMVALGSGSQIRGGTVAGVFCHANGQTATGDGLRLSSATNGIVKGVKVVHNDFVDYQGTPTQLYGFREVGAAADTNWNLFGHNHTFGNVTGPWLLVGTNSVLNANIPEV